MKPGKRCLEIYVERSTAMHNLLFCTHTLCMNYVTNTFLLVSSSVQSKVHSKQLAPYCALNYAKTSNKELCEQKHTTKNFVTIPV